MQNPLVSVVVCTYDTGRYKDVVETIDSILNQTYDNYEIVLVVDGNEELYRKLRDRFSEEIGIKINLTKNSETKGLSISRNTGIKESKGEIIAFIDDDATADKDWLKVIVGNFSLNENILACGGRILPVYEGNSKRLPEEILWVSACTYKGYPEKKQFVRNILGTNMAIRKEAFNYIEFDKDFGRFNLQDSFCEETVFCLKLNEKFDKPVVYDPEAVVYHKIPPERLRLSYIIKRSYGEGVAKARIGRMTRSIFTDTQVFSHEQEYLKVLLRSLAGYITQFRIRNFFLVFLVLSCVSIGYLAAMVKSLSNRKRSD